MNDLNVLKSMLSGIKIERNTLIRRTNKTEDDKNDLKIDELQIKTLESAISALSADGEYIKKENTLKALHDFWDECIGYDGSGTEMMLDKVRNTMEKRVCKWCKNPKFDVIVCCQGQPFHYYHSTLMGALIGYGYQYLAKRKYGTMNFSLKQVFVNTYKEQAESEE